MKSSLYRFLGGAAFLGLWFADACVAADGLSKNSPFIPSGGPSGPAAVSENTPLELRGIMTTANGNVYGLFDPVKRQSSWVKLNEAGNDYTVRNFDAANDAVTVEYQGRVLTLALKAAKIQSMAPSSLPPAVASNPQMPPNSNPNTPPAFSPTPVDEARRLESVAAEVRRRRALRQSAAQAPPGLGQTSSLPPPQNPPPNSPSVLPR